MPNHTGRLVLTTADPLADPDATLLVDTLSRAAFIAAPLPGRCDAYAVGANFLSLLAFSGCAVAIADIPRAEAPLAFCHVRVSTLSPVPRLLWGRNTRPPRCPGCRVRLPDWRQRIADEPLRPHPGVTCTACGDTHSPWHWDWKGHGGFGRRFVLVEEVFPGEAVPTAPLIDLLTDACGLGWRHFYVQD
ncbi:MAG TPA: hypothetical protein VES73_16600 [Lamprocystis sp. (in: g-proteobacteria)]|nr:hypothetical protein [Lamprocystis sp. (in: g-proteobacteria)]